MHSQKLRTCLGQKYHLEWYFLMRPAQTIKCFFTFLWGTLAYECTLTPLHCQCWVWFWQFLVTVKWKWCHDVMVEALDHCRLLPTSIVDVYKVFQHLSMRHVGIWVHPYTVTTQLKLGQLLAILVDSWVEIRPWCNGWGCSPPLITSHLHFGYI